MAIPYRTAKLKSANIFVTAVWDQTAKFNYRQYFWLYGTCFYMHTKFMYICEPCYIHVHVHCRSDLESPDAGGRAMNKGKK